MSGSYRQCVECGKRALSIATRCPACGCERLISAQERRPPGALGRFFPGVVAAVLAAAAILTVARLSQTNGTPNQRSSVAAADSMPSAVLGYIPAATAPLDTASVAALPAATAGELRVTRTWTNVRKSRSRNADVKAVLLPGDKVSADSLERGWYRVALNGKVLGYAHRSTLTAPRRQVD
jgi:hypothetical protein